MGYNLYYTLKAYFHIIYFKLQILSRSLSKILERKFNKIICHTWGFWKINKKSNPIEGCFFGSRSILHFFVGHRVIIIAFFLIKLFVIAFIFFFIFIFIVGVYDVFIVSLVGKLVQKIILHFSKRH